MLTISYISRRWERLTIPQLEKNIFLYFNISSGCYMECYHVLGWISLIPSSYNWAVAPPLPKGVNKMKMKTLIVKITHFRLDIDMLFGNTTYSSLYL